MVRVLVTRPEPGASQTAGRLKAGGFEPVVLPLTQVVPFEPTGLPPGPFGSVAISSANAVRHAPRELLREIAALPAYAVGERTGEAARDAGLNVADSSAGDAERLVRQLVRAGEPGSGVLVLCGRVRRDVLESGLARAGLRPVLVETYDTMPLVHAREAVDAALGRKPVDAVLFYSAFAAEVFTRLLGRSLAPELVESARFLALAPRIAAALPDEFRRRAAIAPEPSEEAMLSLLAGQM